MTVCGVYIDDNEIILGSDKLMINESFDFILDTKIHKRQIKNGTKEEDIYICCAGGNTAINFFVNGVKWDKTEENGLNYFDNFQRFYNNIILSQLLEFLSEETIIDAEVFEAFIIYNNEVYYIFPMSSIEKINNNPFAIGVGKHHIYAAFNLLEGSNFDKMRLGIESANKSLNGCKGIVMKQFEIKY